MKITKKLRKSKGFTLVELLIVIIIIGILAGMMMLATGAATDKAEATKIVSNMRNIKAAAVMAYADGLQWEDMGGATDSVDKYLDQDLLAGSTSPKYELTATASGDVSVEASNFPSTGIGDKLKEIAAEEGSPISSDGSIATMPVN